MTSKNLFLLRTCFSRRTYTVGAEINVRVQAMASSIRKAASESSNKEITGGQKEVFWMRDPKTGNYIPENHFDEVDVAELREKLLCKKHE